jgi:hypothetical protein
MIMSNDTLDVIGVAHWSARGSIDSDVWEWGLLVDQEEVTKGHRLEIRTEEATDFVNDLKPYLPDNYESRMVSPDCIPGGCFSLKIPLTDFKKPEEVYSILQKYFPKDI